MLNTLRRSVTQFWRHLLSRRTGISLDPTAMLGPSVVLRPGYLTRRGRIGVGAGCALETGVLLEAWGGHISLGQNVFVGPFTVIYGHGGVEIGDDCLIAMHCRILSSNHAVPPLGTPVRSLPDELRPTKIGRDVWLGAGVTVLGGVTIGDGCIVGAGAVVTKDLPRGSISHGVPAVVAGWRSGAGPA